MRHLSIFRAVFFASFIVFVGCSDDDDDKSTDPTNSGSELVGTWSLTDEALGEVTFVFSENANATLTNTANEDLNKAGTYEVDGDTLTLTDDEGGELILTFSISGNTLTTTDDEGEVLIFTKQ